VVTEAEKLEALNARGTELLFGKTVVTFDYRREGHELFIEFDDGTRLFVNASGNLDVSITGG
jgi:hypothetical protein